MREARESAERPKREVGWPDFKAWWHEHPKLTIDEAVKQYMAEVEARRTR